MDATGYLVLPRLSSVQATHLVSEQAEVAATTQEQVCLLKPAPMCHEKKGSLELDKSEELRPVNLQEAA